MVSAPYHILNYLGHIMRTFYKAVPGWTGKMPREYLGALQLPTLLKEDLKFLDKGFSVEEIEAAIRSFPSSKTSGPDGLPSEW